MDWKLLRSCSCILSWLAGAMLWYTLPTSGYSPILTCYYPGYLDIVTPTELDPHLCTHLIYAFAYVKDGLIAPASDVEESKYRNLILLKEKNPDLKVLLSVQGSLSPVVKQKSERERFSRDIVALLQNFGFDGLDVNWEYPTPVEKEGFLMLLQEIRRASDGSSLILTAAVPAYRHLIQTCYDAPKMAEVVDSVHLMTYDLHKAEPRNLGVTAFNSPLYAPRDDPTFDSMESATRAWEEMGMPKHKIIIGIPAYGITFTLMNSSNHGFHAPVSGPGTPGKVLYTTGYYSYTESCWLLANGATRVVDTITQTPYMFLDTLWVSYDDVESVAKKSKWIRQKRYGGAMVWNLQLDDVTGACTGTTFPLLKTIKRVSQGENP
ncbi:acidic mammalian chitinase-like [Liolophura sinensis]|uniref:acidic mammalian chitinase-like n=1 Tax=Liolophura sinensis TaxID=3198878 RepID=UPI0031597FDD